MVQIKLRGVIGVESPSPRSFWCGSTAFPHLLHLQKNLTVFSYIKQYCQPYFHDYGGKKVNVGVPMSLLRKIEKTDKWKTGKIENTNSFFPKSQPNKFGCILVTVTYRELETTCNNIASPHYRKKKK